MEEGGGGREWIHLVIAVRQGSFVSALPKCDVFVAMHSPEPTARERRGAQVMHGFPMCHKIALFSPWLEPAALFLARLVWKKGFGIGNIESYSARRTR